MNRTWKLFPIAIVVAASLVVWNHATMDRLQPASRSFSVVATLADFTENFVHVTIYLERDDQHRSFLRAAFEPTEAGFHLYSKDLPDAGIHGFGVPTRFDLPPQPGVAASGPVSVDVSPHEIRIEDLHLSLPVYPDGAVNMRLPVALPPGGAGGSVQCSVSFMSCQTNGVCRFPVKQKLVQLEIPKQI